MQNRVIINPHSIILPIGFNTKKKERLINDFFLPFLKNNDIQHVATNLAHLEESISYPCTNEVVVMDTTGMDNFEQVFVLAEKHHFKVVGFHFDNFNQPEFFKSLSIDTKRFNSFHQLSNKKYEVYNFIFEGPNIKLVDAEMYSRYCIVTDPHACLDVLIECVTDNKGLSYDKVTNTLFVSDPLNYVHHILNGDYIDKGNQNKEMIEFLYKNRQFFWINKGNHENYVYKYFTGQLDKKDTKSAHVIKKYFNSIPVLEADENCRKMFLELFENSYDFIDCGDFIVTHAPCKAKYLGKTDAKSLRRQRSITYPKKSDYERKMPKILKKILKFFFKSPKIFVNFNKYNKEKGELFSFLIDDADHKAPFHFFGHVAIDEVFNFKNKYNLDTSCAKGNKLTAALMDSNVSKFPILKSYSSGVKIIDKKFPEKMF